MDTQSDIQPSLSYKGHIHTYDRNSPKAMWFVTDIYVIPALSYIEMLKFPRFGFIYGPSYNIKEWGCVIAHDGQRKFDFLYASNGYLMSRKNSHNLIDHSI